MIQRENKGKRVVLYPHYFDSRLSRSKGRRVPVELAVKSPTAERIAIAARSLGLDAYIEDARYPRAWWVSSGRVVVEKRGMSKTEIIRMIASKLSEKQGK